MIGDILTEIASGLASFVPAFFKAILDGTVALLFNSTTTEAGVTTINGLSPVGSLGIIFFVIAMCYRFLPTIIGWVKLGAGGIRRRFSRKKS